jgi:hypothetical protein
MSDRSSTNASAAFAGAISGAITGALYHIFQPPPSINQEDWGIITTALFAAQGATIALAVFLVLALTILRFRSTDQIVGYLTAFWVGAFLFGSIVAWAFATLDSSGSTNSLRHSLLTPLNWAVFGTILGAIVVSRKTR